MINKLGVFSSLAVVIMFGATINSWATRAQKPAEQAISRSYQDPQLKWNPCPSIFPTGCEFALLQGDPASGRSDVFLKTPANYKFPPHWHTSPEHMILVSGELHVSYEGQEPSVLKPGSYAYGPAKAKHEARCADAGPCVLFIAFESPIDATLVEGTSQ